MHITRFDFSGIYETAYEDFSPAAEGPSFLYREKEDKITENKNASYLIKCSDIKGTNAYCDAEAEAELRRRICSVPEIPAGIHFLDNGNYHYLSALITGQIKISYALLLIDHHPDCRTPAFGDVLSCGSWVLRSLQTQPMLRRVVMAGVDEALFQEELGALSGEQKGSGSCGDGMTPGLLLEEKVHGMVAERIRFVPDSGGSSLAESVMRQLPEDLPVFLSIDKDVLSTEEVRTNWDQGEMRLEELL
ncbi:MAG: hypothetical protein IJP92_15540, partial [Lachnospiraceae bacterium]|nr:hypothetical protein [Lachnospiraceae bacterium]